jgi:putative ABC transport system ATP-binding protein
MASYQAVTAVPTIEIESAARAFAVRGGVPFDALRGITLSIDRGEFVAVLGKSGSGKSTLLNLIAGLDRASTGSVRVAGMNLGDLNERDLARWRGRNVGVVFQFFQLLPTLTILENIMLAMEFVGTVPRADRRKIAADLLQRVGLRDHAGKLPARLSGGEQQRAAIARALANDPPIVVADEPTGNLDSETAADVHALFSLLARQGKTLLIVTHDAALAQAAHRTVRLRDGRIVADTALPAAA